MLSTYLNSMLYTSMEGVSASTGRRYGRSVPAVELDYRTGAWSKYNCKATAQRTLENFFLDGGLGPSIRNLKWHAPGLPARWRTAS